VMLIKTTKRSSSYWNLSIAASLTTLLLFGGGSRAASAFEYDITSAGEISLTDVETSISGLMTIFVDEYASVSVSGLEWGQVDNETTTNQLQWTTS